MTNPSRGDGPGHPLRKAWETGRLAFRKNRTPAVLLWLFGTVLVLGYYQVPAIREQLDAVGQVKQQWGWRFSALSTAMFGGILPLTINRLGGPSNETPRSILDLITVAVFWAYKGVEVDCLYHFQGWMLGTEAEPMTIAIKTAIDQFLYVPALGLTNVILFYGWRDRQYALGNLWVGLDAAWYRHRVLPILIPNWVVWIPAVALVYCLPLALQLPVENLVLCFWVLILFVFTREDR